MDQHETDDDDDVGRSGSSKHFYYLSLQTLVADLEGDTHGDFEDLLVALVTPLAVYDCREVIGAIKVSLSSVHFKLRRH